MTAKHLISLRHVLSGPVLFNSIAVMLVVGTLLNVINQGDALVKGSSLNWTKVCLTYLMPFLVASFASWKVMLIEKAPD